MTQKTLYQKLWDAHIVHQEDDGSALLYIDRHLVHEVTSPQAFEGLEIANREIWRKDSILAVPDHNVPTTDRSVGITDSVARLQVETLNNNSDKNRLTQFKMDYIRQGIVQVIGPEQGATLPGMTVVCGDSHTSTLGAFGALAFGIGTSEVEHVLATQCLVKQPAKTLNVVVSGKVPVGVTGKDIALAIIGKIGTAGGTGYCIEFSGEAISDLSVEGRMSLCNMAIEAGAGSGLVAVDNKTIEYFKGRPFSPSADQWEQAVS
jgi:3-isopropylmalate/(R)-2-methylmalate dehydratase large subunit